MTSLRLLAPEWWQTVTLSGYVAAAVFVIAAWAVGFAVLVAPLLGLRRIDRRFDWVQFDRDMSEGEK